MRRIFRLLLPIALLAMPLNLLATASPQSAPNIAVNGSLATNKIGRGRTTSATVLMEVPSGFHTNSNRPLEKFLIATLLQVEAPSGVKVGPVVYPRALLRSVRFSKNKVSVFEGRTTMRFSVTVPRNYSGNSVELRARLRFQSCSDDTCFPPQTREVKLGLNVE